MSIHDWFNEPTKPYDPDTLIKFPDGTFHRAGDITWQECLDAVKPQPKDEDE